MGDRKGGCADDDGVPEDGLRTLSDGQAASINFQHDGGMSRSAAVSWNLAAGGGGPESSSTTEVGAAIMTSRSSLTKTATDDATLLPGAGRNADRRNLKLSARKFGIQHLPVSIVEKIIGYLNQTDLTRAMASSFTFLRAGLSPCFCKDFRQSRLVATVVESRRGFLKIVVPVGPRTRWLESAATMLKRFLAVAFRSHGWIRAIDCRAGAMVVIRDSRATMVQILRPFETMSVTRLPEAPVSDANELVTAGIIPMADREFSLFMLLRGKFNHISLKIFNSDTGCWQLKEMSCPFMLSPAQNLRTVGIYSSGNLYVLDPIIKKILIFDINSHHLDAISLPTNEIQNPLNLGNNILARTRGGELYWIALDGYSVHFFMLCGSTWTRRWRRRIDCIPGHSHTVELFGHAEDSGMVIFKWSGQICGMDIEDGTLQDFIGSVTGTIRCLAFELDHVLADHAEV